ncbi:hypothetical protein [Pedobacter sp. WC2423]|uniref:hypothetical protein n=1 Tax=Pedobacter sp. WC2423 TaxID=3234142 RepID=UPI003464F5D8
MNVIIFTLTGWSAMAQKSKNTAYLFTYFTGNKGLEESIHFAISNDGYTYRALNHNQPVISSAAISLTGGVRDPHILRGSDGKTFYMVVTDMVAAKGWDANRAMVLLKSADLVNWTSSIVNIQKRFPDVQQTTDPVEGAGVFKLNTGEGYILMYDVYTKGRYQFTKTKDLKHFTVIDHDVKMDFHPRHGTVLPITAREAKILLRKWDIR